MLVSSHGIFLSSLYFSGMENGDKVVFWLVMPHPVHDCVCLTLLAHRVYVCFCVGHSVGPFFMNLFVPLSSSSFCQAKGKILNVIRSYSKEIVINLVTKHILAYIRVTHLVVTVLAYSHAFLA
uniref:Uncharacterized protein n=1 Tax=Trypanosoma vivax (strain Y486) TaxID=1055687 RepID=G0TTM9_TRYVY|nr:conserved hypothetical protein [Trypanosoma vivax Y486]